MAVADAVAWWGEGAPPTERWPGVTVPIDDAEGRFHFDPALADRVCEFFPRYCSHSKGAHAGQKFDLLAYQRDLILRPLFGWVDAAGLRRFRKAYIQIPKKNGKTQLIAGLALYMLLADREPGAEVYVAAADRDQARILFEAAKAMVEANPYLAKRVTAFQNVIKRNDDPTAFFKVLSAEAATKHGPNIHCLIIDELHAQPDRELFETLTRGVIARRQPLILLITTAGDDDESICAEERDYALRVLSGTVQDVRHLPVVFEAAKDDNPYVPETWRKVNPALGDTITEDALATFAREAEHEPRKRNDFLRYHLNRWVNQATAWLPVEWWDACADPLAPDAELAQLPCAAGMDLARKIDLAALVLVFRHRLAGPAVELDVKQEAEDGSPISRQVQLNYRITVLPFFWIPRETMREREALDGVPYSDWERKGLVTPTDGFTIDYDHIYRDITTKIVPRFPRVKQGGIGYDPAFATDIVSSLRDKAGFKVAEILQNYKYMNEPSHVLEALIKAQRVTHGGHRVLRNHIEHVAVRTDDAGRIRPVRPKKAGKHIDGVVGLLEGLTMLAGLPDVPVNPVGGFVVRRKGL